MIGETNGAVSCPPGQGAVLLAVRPVWTDHMLLEPFFVSTLVVAIAEIGDKTQLLAIVLATRFRKPWPIIAGIFVATLANHGLAALAGRFLSGLLEGRPFRIAVALAFIGMAAWALVPDKEDETKEAKPGASVFLTTVVAFFLVEMGDKTQIATAALAAQFQQVLLVTAGTTVGMMLANVPAVLLGEAATRIVPLRIMRIVAALIFLGLGLFALAQALGWYPGGA
jgi:putative Ca2+/H+ antiporter (TMEM165/GDT1 family)